MYYFTKYDFYFNYYATVKVSIFSISLYQFNKLIIYVCNFFCKVITYVCACVCITCVILCCYIIRYTKKRLHIHFANTHVVLVLRNDQ